GLNRVVSHSTDSEKTISGKAASTSNAHISIAWCRSLLPRWLGYKPLQPRSLSVDRFYLYYSSVDYFYLDRSVVNRFYHDR
ncbi:hypothetical protein Dimus_003387, partial [Dionaea muscipula]